MSGLRRRPVAPPGYRCDMEPSGTLEPRGAGSTHAAATGSAGAATAARPRVRGRRGQPRRGDRRRAPARALLRRLDDHLGEHDRVVLVALSVGYWLGGRLADRHPTRAGAAPDSCSRAAVLLAVVPFVAGPFLHAAVRALDHVDGRRVRRLAGRRARARRGAGAAARRGLAVGDPARRRAVERGRRGRRAAVRDLDGRLARRRLRSPRSCSSRSSARSARSSSSRSRSRSPRRRPACRAARCSCRSRSARCWRCPPGVTKPAERRAGRVRDRRPRTSTRAWSQVRRRAPARAQRGPGDPLALPAGHRADRRLLGRLHRAAVRRGWTAARAGSRSSATPAARSRAPTAASSRARASTASRSTATLTRGRPALLRPARPAACTCTRRTRGRSCAGTRTRYDVDRRRRLPPALHPVLPGHEGVLRTGPRAPDAARRGDHQRRAPRGRVGAREGRWRPRCATAFPARDARPDRADEHDAGRIARRPVDQHAWPRRSAPELRPRWPDGRGALGPALTRRQRLHRRQRAGRMAGRHVDRPLRRRKRP